MSYCMSLRSQNFFLKRDDSDKVLAALKELFREHPDSPSGFGKFSWINTNVVLSAKTLQEAMNECRWEFQTNGGDNGDFDVIEFNGEKLGEDELIFSAIAPFVKDGSFIEMEGEDGSLWKWIFNDGKVKEKMAKIVYEC